MAYLTGAQVTLVSLAVQATEDIELGGKGLLSHQPPPSLPSHGLWSEYYWLRGLLLTAGSLVGKGRRPLDS